MGNWQLAVAVGLLLGLLWAWRLNMARRRGMSGLWEWPLAAGVLFAIALAADLAGWLKVWQFTGVIALLLSAASGLSLLLARSAHDRKAQEGVVFSPETLLEERRRTDDTIMLLGAAIALMVGLPLLGEADARAVALGGCVAVGVTVISAVYAAWGPTNRPPAI